MLLRQFIPKLSINNSSPRLANSDLIHIISSRETPEAEFTKPSKAESCSKLTNLGVKFNKIKGRMKCFVHTDQPTLWPAVPRAAQR